jgi:hypothetical protein
MAADCREDFTCGDPPPDPFELCIRPGSFFVPANCPNHAQLFIIRDLAESEHSHVDGAGAHEPREKWSHRIRHQQHRWLPCNLLPMSDFGQSFVKPVGKSGLEPPFSWGT